MRQLAPGETAQSGPKSASLNRPCREEVGKAVPAGVSNFDQTVPSIDSLMNLTVPSQNKTLTPPF